MQYKEFINGVNERLRTNPAIISIPELELKEWVEYYFGLSGKRARPSVFWAVFEACGGKDWERALKVATAIEITHNWTLVEDDWMDHDLERRGEPSLHVKAAGTSQGFSAHGNAMHYGQTQATLVTNFLQSMASSEFALAVSDLPNAQELINYFESAVREVIRGQYLDFLIQDKLLAGLEVTELESRECNMAKTASLFRLASFMAATLAGGDTNYWEKTGEKLGFIFQQHNDLKDFNPQASEGNRQPFSDLREFKATSINVLLASALVGEEKASWHAFADGDESKLPELENILSKHNILSKCRQNLETEITEFKALLSPLPETTGKAFIIESLKLLTA